MKTRDSVVVITGASSGIGRATALRFAKEGAKVVVAGRREQALDSLVEECKESGAEAIAVPTDVTDLGSVEHLAERAVEAFGRIDVWVNNAAVSQFSEFADAPLDEFRRVLDVNVMGYVHGAKTVLPIMEKQGRGTIVNVSSITAEVPQPYTAAYSMSKAAVRALGTSLRSELMLRKQKNVNVCTVLPATIDTPLFQHAANHTGRKVKAMPPVYPAKLVAKKIVKLARKPQREVVVGPAGKAMVGEHRTAPDKAENMMAMQVEKTHLSRDESAPDSHGNLYEPIRDERYHQVDGGWHGEQSTNRRRGLLVGTLLSGAGFVAWRMIEAKNERERRKRRLRIGSLIALPTTASAIALPTIAMLRSRKGGGKGGQKGMAQRFRKSGPRSRGNADATSRAGGGAWQRVKTWRLGSSTGESRTIEPGERVRLVD